MKIYEYITLTAAAIYLAKQLVSLGSRYRQPKREMMYPLPLPIDESQNYIPIPDHLISILSEHGPFLEMCAGHGHTATKLRMEGVDVLAYDQEPCQNGGVLAGLAGLVEREHPDRTLLLCAPQSADASVYSYTEGGGKKVILFGYATVSEQCASYTRHYGNVDDLLHHRPVKWTCYDTTGEEVVEVYSDDCRPDHDFMTCLGWNLESGDINEHRNRLFIYRIYTR